nr:PapG chaperone-binding domain-containing protein [Buttiauxella ferragutiae]
MSGANNWWTTNPAGTPEYKQTIYLPLDIRIDDTGEPGNPDVICSLSSTDITLSHGNVLYNNAHRNIKQESFAITCDGETTVDITLQGMDNTHDPYTVVNMGPGPGLSSYLSVSLNQTDWARTLTGAALVNGATTFYLQSELQAGSDLLPGSYTGSAVAIVNIL